MDAIGSINAAAARPYRVGAAATEATSLDSPLSPAAGRGFAGAIGDALDQISKTQADANTLAKEFQLENPNVGLEETMVSLQKASLGFQAVVQVRNKLVQAYNDVMNMNV